MAMLADLPAAILLERLPVPVLMIGADAAVIFTNDAFAEMLGYSRATLSALTLHQLFPTLPLEKYALDTFHDRAGCIVELVHADQSMVLARMSKSALLRHDDPIALLTFNDVTEEIWTNPRFALRSPPSTP